MWHSENWKPEAINPTEWHGAMGGFVWPGNLVAAAAGVLGDAGSYGPLFAYMFRRFGMSEWGSDDYKEISQWYITTPNENVVLNVVPKPSGMRLSFGYKINRAVYNNDRNNNQVMAVENALKSAMLDLLTPVFVRDVAINALGMVEDPGEEIVPPFKWAGYGVSHQYYEEIYGRRHTM